MEGDVVGAIGEFTSGLAATIPGYGTAASVAIDATLLGRDIMAANETLSTLQADFEKENGSFNNVYLTGPAQFVYRGEIQL